MLASISTEFFPKQSDKVGVAVSGGGDSLALLRLMAEWSRETGLLVEAVTVDHGLRPEAATEAQLVANICEELSVQHRILQWDGLTAQGNLMAAARSARYRLIAEWAKSRELAAVYLGHTKDDVAENFLMRLSRKSGVNGLAKMAAQFERHEMTWVRPLMSHDRASLRDYLRRKGLVWSEDPTNDDIKYQRVRARQALKTLGDTGIDADVLADVSEAMRDARDALEFYTVQEAERLLTFHDGDVLLVQRPPDDIPSEVRSRMVRAILQWIGGQPYAPRESEMENLRFSAIEVRDTTLAGCFVRYEADGITRFSRELNAVSSLCVDLSEPSTIWDRWAIDGPHAPNLTIRALGESLKDVPDWREVGLPRASLMASPAVFDGETLVSAPVAGLQNGFSARIVADFESFLLSR